MKKTVLAVGITFSLRYVFRIEFLNFLNRLTKRSNLGRTSNLSHSPIIGSESSARWLETQAGMRKMF